MNPSPRDNFYHCMTLIVDNGNEAAWELLDFYLSNQGTTLKDFLENNQHEIYHLCYNYSRCCRCQYGTVNKPKSRILYQSQLDILLDTKGSNFPCHVHVHVKPSCSHTINDYFANPNIATNQLDLTLCRCLLINFTNVLPHGSVERNAFEDLINMRNKFCHAAKGEISSKDYQAYKGKIEHSLLALAKIYGKTHDMQLKIKDAEKRPFDESICKQLQQTILQEQVLQGVSGLHKHIESSQEAEERMTIEIQKLGKSTKRALRVVKSSLKSTGHTASKLQKLEESTKRTLMIVKKSIDHTASKVQKQDANTERTLQAVESSQKSIEHTGARIHKLVENSERTIQAVDSRQKSIEHTSANIEKKLEESSERTILAVESSQESTATKIEKLDECETSKRSRLLGLTKTEIDGHLKEGTFVETPAVQACIKLLETNSLLVLTGAAGTGKSRNSLEILNQFHVKNSEFETVKLTDLHDFTDVVTEDKKLVILFEDIFGRTNTRFAENTDVQIIDRIHACTSKGNIKVILTVRDTIRISCQWILNSHKIFHGKCEVDLSSEKFKMKKTEKESLLLKYFVAHNFQLLEYNDPENYFEEVILDPQITATVNRVTLHNIVESEPLLGFPEACSLFTGNRKLTRLGLSFFKHPSKYLFEEIEKIRKNGKDCEDDRMSYVTLVYILLNDDVLDPDNIELKICLEILESCYGISNKKLPVCNITDAANEMIGRYLILHCDDGKYHFQHQTIFESILLSYSRIDPGLILSRLKFDFIKEMVRLQNYTLREGEVVMKIAPKYYSMLANRIIEIIHTEYFNTSLSLNFQLLCESEIIKQNDECFIKYLIEKAHDAYFKPEYSLQTFVTYSGDCRLCNLYLPALFLERISQQNKMNKSIILLVDHITSILNSETEENIEFVCKSSLIEAFLHVCELENNETILDNIWVPIKKLFMSEMTEYIRSCISRICSRCPITTMKWMLKNIDQNIFDMNHILKRACEFKRLDVVKFLCETINHDQLDFTKAFIAAINNVWNDPDESVSEWLVKNIDHSFFDMKQITNEVLEVGCKKNLNFLLINVDNCMLDMKLVFAKQYKEGKHRLESLFRWIISNVNKTKINTFEMLILTCIVEDIELVKILFNNIDPGLLDVSSVLLSAVNSNWQGNNKDLIEWLCLNVDLKQINMMDIVNKAFEEEKYDELKVLLKNNEDNLNSVLRNACKNKQLEVLKIVLSATDHHSLNLREAVRSVCFLEKMELLEFFLYNVDHRLYDVHHVLKESCRYGWTHIVKWLLDNIEYSSLDIHTSMKIILHREFEGPDKKLVRLLLQYPILDTVDVAEIIQECCWWGILDLVQLVCEKIDPKQLDMKEAMNTACSRSHFDLVEWMLSNIENNLFDLTIAFDKAMHADCDDLNASLIQLLLGHTDHKLIDMTSLFRIGCKRCWYDIVEWVLENADHTVLYHVYVNEAINIACDTSINDMPYCNDMDINERRKMYEPLIKIILQKVNLDSIDIQYILNKSGFHGSLDIFRLVLEYTDHHKMLDMNEAMNIVYDKWKQDGYFCNSKDVKDRRKQYEPLIKLILQKENHNSLDLKKVLNTACCYGSLDIVTLVLENTDHKKLDVKEAMNIVYDEWNNVNAYCDKQINDRRDKYEPLIKLILEKANHDSLDVKKVLNTACCYGAFDVASLVLKNTDHRMLHINEAMNIVYNNWKYEARFFNTMDVNDRMKKYETLIKLILQKVIHDSLDLKEVLNTACRYGSLNVVTLVLENTNHKKLDVMVAIDTIFITRKNDGPKYYYDETINDRRDKYELLVIFFLENVNHHSIDLKKVFDQACCYGYLDVVTFVLENTDHKKLDIMKAVNISYSMISEDCNDVNNQREKYEPLIKLILEKVNHDFLDLNKIFNHACFSNCLGDITFLLENTDHKKLDIMVAVIMVYSPIKRGGIIHQREKFVSSFMKLILEKVNHDSLDLKKVFNQACQYGNLDAVTGLLQNIDHKKLDIMEAVIIVYSSQRYNYYGGINYQREKYVSSFMKLILEKVNHDSLDLKKVFNQACCFGILDAVTVLLENTDHKKLDIREAVNKACNPSIDDNSNNSFFDKNSNEKLIKLLLQKVKSDIFDMEGLMNDACKNDWLNIVKWLVENIDHSMFDIETAINVLILHGTDGNFDIFKLLLENISHNLFDIGIVIEQASRLNHTEKVLWLLQTKDNSLFEMKYVMNEACRNSNLQIIQYVWENMDTDCFDTRSAMNKACRSSKTNSLKVVKWLLENIPHNMLNLESAMNNACRYDNVVVVEWFWNNLDRKLFNVKTAWNNACYNCNEALLSYLLYNMDENMLDKSMALSQACRNFKEGDKIIALLFKQPNVNTSENCKMVLKEACVHSNRCIVNWLLENTDFQPLEYKETLIDTIKATTNKSNDDDKFDHEDLVWLMLTHHKIKKLDRNDLSGVMEAVSSIGQLVMVQQLLHNTEQSMFNMRAIVNTACESGKFEIVDWFLQNIELKSIDVQTVMVESCGYGWLKIVKLLWSEFDEENFDMRTSMDESCSYGRYEIVKFLLENVDSNLLDTKLVLKKSCGYGWKNIILWLFDNIDNISIDSKECLFEACAQGRLEIVELFWSKYGRNNFDVDTLIGISCKNSGNTGIIKFFIENFDLTQSHIDIIIKTACKYSWTEIVRSVLDVCKHNKNLMEEAMKNACNSGETEIVEIFLDKIDISFLGVKTNMVISCQKGWDEIVSLLLERVDHSLFDFTDAMNEACRCGEADIVELLIQKVSRKNLNFDTALVEAFKGHLNENLVLILLNDINQSTSDIEGMSKRAREYGWRKVSSRLKRISYNEN